VPLAHALLIALLLWAAPPRARAAEVPAAPTLEQVMRLLSESEGVRARYREQKHLRLLARPLESEGMLFFDPPDHLARQVEKPGRAQLVVRGDEVVMRDATGQEQLRLDRSEVARGLVESVAVVLRGDLALLRSRYEVAFRSDGSAWVMDLTPRSRALRSLVRSMAIQGVGCELRRVEVREGGGDWTVTEFTEVETGLRFTAEQREEIFLLDIPPLAR